MQLQLGVFISMDFLGLLTSCACLKKQNIRTYLHNIPHRQSLLYRTVLGLLVALLDVAVAFAFFAALNVRTKDFGSNSHGNLLLAFVCQHYTHTHTCSSMCACVCIHCEVGVFVHIFQLFKDC